MALSPEERGPGVGGQNVGVRNFEPLIPLLPYQKRWIEDRSFLKIMNKGRQIGFSFMVALEAVLDCWETKRPWVLLSAGERQAKELIEKVEMHARAINLAIETIEERFKADDAEYKQLEVRLPGGGKIIGLPANPATARGFSANVALDEFAHHKDARKIWTALYPTITRGYKLRVGSTPNGRQNMFYDLWTHNEKFSKHQVSIYDAVRDGLAIDVDDLRSGVSDPDAWAQEYECAFVDEATAYLTYEQISEIESDQATTEFPLPVGVGANLVFAPDPGDHKDRPYYLGMDIGRKRDLSVIWIWEKVGDVLWTRAVKILEKTPFRVQREVLFDLIPRVRRACIDASGIGAQLAEEAAERFGSKAEGIVFTARVKEDLAVTFRGKVEDVRLRIPIDRAIREDFHSIKKIVTSSGNVRFDAERTEAGHSDRFWSAALGVHAAEGTPWVPEFEIPRRGGRQFGKMAGYLREM